LTRTAVQRTAATRTVRLGLALGLAALVALALPGSTLAHEPEFTSDFDRERCTFTSSGSNYYFPLWPGYGLLLEGEEEDEGETVEIGVLVTVLTDTETVDGVETRVVEERESEDGELVEVSRNFMAICRETGDLWYFGEDVDDYEDGEIVGHGGAWRAGVDGAVAGVLQPGSPMNGARFQQELAPGVAEDRAEVIGKIDEVVVPAGTFHEVLEVLDTDALEPESEGDVKLYAPGVGLIQDEEIQLVEIVPAPCMPDATTLCLEDGRFRVRAEWATDQGTEGDAMVTQVSDDSGEMWFFRADNVELLVKVLDACGPFDRYWFFAAGLTHVEVEITVTDTLRDVTLTYDNDLGEPFEPILDTGAFATCP